MIEVKLRDLFFILLFFILTACGGKTVNSSNDLLQVNAQVQEKLQIKEISILGYWRPQNASNEEFEFFSSATEGPNNQILRTGRIFKGGALTYRFYWSLQLDGVINISTVSPGCNARPLDNCEKVSSIAITLTGDSLQSANWSIARAENNAKVKQISDSYHRVDFDLSGLNAGDFFLTGADYFDRPLRGNLAGSNISIRLDGLSEPISVFGLLPKEKSQKIEFSNDEKLAVVTQKEFYVDGIGYKNFSIKQSYKDIALSASANNQYSLVYTIHSELLVPAEINPDLIRHNDFVSDRVITKVVGIIDRFLTGPRVVSTDKFYSYIPIDFDKNGDSDNNQLFFISNSGGIVGHEDLFKGLRSAAKEFNWVQREDGTVILSIPNFGEITIKFINTIAGGYKVLFSWPDPVLGTAYFIHDLLRENYVAIDKTDFPGRFEFSSSNQWQTQEISFLKNETISSEPNLVGGYWFKDFNGDIVSYECADLIGISLKNYSDCFESFSNLTKVSFAHIRRLHILNKTGNKYKIKYDAIYYGDRYFTTGDKYSIISWTYDWSRIGDEPK